mmetsp:Transcript_20715/g.29962  ORF Transcript_20715/g.29962 Transcript_20715/m.29962 type:complete len:102 (-) Transcript_20715:372-677(-)|eukprot:CAMPEP_0113934616 /NCGR_PEP_ID=MMETSP1339-20121228/1921_1 /TAXON_ID=94617 /ORGANISM="Fibrocapsa japonica" /LENGTH=101 /DNA_ID=CAMNT_0000936487 /DNA_START=100 /DNA_END=405 /DNA_ORIENTATION=+ /assembly_acc=CAM_ASM_000762
MPSEFLSDPGKFLSTFVGLQIGWTFNFVFAHILFWAFGLPTVVEYGYDDEKKGSWGNIPSGPSGSGVFPISLILMVGATLTIIKKMAAHSIAAAEAEKVTA